MVFSEWYKVPLWERTLRKIIFYMQREEQDRTSWMASLSPPKRSDFVGL
jgi:hypothetical protein